MSSFATPDTRRLGRSVSRDRLIFRFLEISVSRFYQRSMVVLPFACQPDRSSSRPRRFQFLHRTVKRWKRGYPLFSLSVSISWLSPKQYENAHLSTRQEAHADFRSGVPVRAMFLPLTSRAIAIDENRRHSWAIYPVSAWRLRFLPSSDYFQTRADAKCPFSGEAPQRTSSTLYVMHMQSLFGAQLTLGAS